MPSIRVTTLVPGAQEALYEYITAFPVRGEPNMPSLERKYGHFQSRKGHTYTFHEDDGGGTTWECTFQPPDQRAMQTFDSTWSNRTDYFQAAQGGTLWTIVWEPKGWGWSGITQWLAFHLRHRKQVHKMIVLPVLEHFQGTSPDTERTFY